MNNSFHLTVITLLLAVSNLSATTHYVSLGSTNPTPPYTNWVTAATNIQQAVDAAAASDVVMVTNGVYPGGVAVTNPVVLRSVNGPQFTIINGGGPCVYLTSDAMMVGFTLTNGWAYSGRGVYCESRSAVLSNCVLSGNSAGWNGGGGALSCTLNNCTLTGNLGWGASSATLNNCIVYFNSDPNGGNYDPSSTLNYYCTAPLPTNGVGNITNAPLFVDYAAGDFRLRPDSPCIDAGTNLMGFTMTSTNADTGDVTVLAYSCEPTDILSNARFMDGNGDGIVAWDIGAYEFTPYRFEPTLHLSASGFQFIVRGEPARSVRIERSRDLVNCELAGEVPIPACGQTLIDC